MAFLDSTGLAHLVSKLKTWTQNLISSLSPDGKTIKNTSGQMVAHDIDLSLRDGGDKTAIERGFITGRLQPTYSGDSPNIDASGLTITDFNLLVEPGMYHIRFETATVLNGPPGLTDAEYIDGLLIVRTISSAANISSNYSVRQIFIHANEANDIKVPIFTRLLSGNNPYFTLFRAYDWEALISSDSMGEGIAFNANTINVVNGFAYKKGMPRYPGTTDMVWLDDLNSLTTPGRYHILLSLKNTANMPFNYVNLANDSAAADEGQITALVEVDYLGTDGFISSYHRVRQRLNLFSGSTSVVRPGIWERYFTIVSGSVSVYIDWYPVAVGDYGIHDSNSIFLNRNITKTGVSSNNHISLYFFGEDLLSGGGFVTNNYDRLAYIGYSDNNSIVRGLRFMAYDRKADSQDNISILLGYKDEEPIAQLSKSPPASSDDKSIATTEWVRDYVQSVMNS